MHKGYEPYVECVEKGGGLYVECDEEGGLDVVWWRVSFRWSVWRELRRELSVRVEYGGRL